MSDEKKVPLYQKLTRVREALLALIESVDEQQWQRPVFAEAESWTAVDLLRHVANAEQSMTRLMMQIREGGEGVPADFDLNRWNARTVAKAQDKTLAQLVVGLDESRQQLLQFIDTLADDDWQKQGRHGSMRIMSIEEICHLIADHEQRHTEDLRRAFAAAAT